MADSDFFNFDGLGEDELRQRLAVVQAERQRRAQDRTTYQTVKDAQDAAAIPQQAAQNQGDIAQMQAVGSADIPDWLKATSPQYAAPPAPVINRVQDIANQTAATSLAQPGQNLSPDIEAANLTPGAREVVAGDQRLVVDQNGSPLATREEFPPVAKHIKALFTGQPTDASVVGAMGNVMEGLSRPAATAFNYAATDKPIDASNIPGDILGAAAGTSGSSGTVSEGGMVAKRGGGWGDVIRQKIAEMRGQSVGQPGADDNSTLAALAPTVAQGIISPAGPLAMLYAGAKVRDYTAATGPQREATLGDVLGSIGLPSEIMKPAIGALAQVKHAAQLAHAQGMTGMGDIGKALSAVSPALGMIFDLTKTDVDPEYAAPDSPDKIHSDMMAQFSPDRPLSTISPEDPSIDAYGQIASTLYDPMNVVPVEKLPEAIFSAAEKAGVPLASVGRRAVTYDLTKMFSRESGLESKLYRDAIGAGAAPDLASADAKKMSEGVYGESQRIHAEAQLENNAQQQMIERARSEANVADSPQVRQLLEGAPDVRLRDKPDAMQLADIRLKAEGMNYSGLSTEEEHLVRQIPPNVMSHPTALAKVPKEVLFNRQRLADKLGVDTVLPHAWERSADMAQQRAVTSAKQLRRVLARNLEQDQLLKLLPEHIRPEGFFPHSPRSPVAVGLERAGVPKPIAGAAERLAEPFVSRLPYSPRARREMAAMGDVEVLRRASNVVVRDAVRTGQPVPRLLRDFASKPELRRNKAVINQVRQELLQAHNVAVYAPEGTVEEAQRLAEHRKAVGSGRRADVPVNFEQDPARNVAAYRNAVAPAQQGAAMGEAIKGLKDSRGEPVAESLLDAVINPRHGTPDKLLFDKMRQDPNGIHAALFEDGRLIDDAHRYLEKKGLHFIGSQDPLVKSMPTLANHVVPKAIYHDMMDAVPKLRAGVLEKAANLMAKSINFWAPVVLNTPGFHIRNALFGQFQVFLGVGADIADHALWRMAGQVASAAEKDGLAHGVVSYLGRHQKLADLVAEARRTGVYEGGRVADLEGYVQRGMAPYADQKVQDFLRRVNPFSQRGLITKEPLAKVAASRGIGGALSLGGGAASAENVQRMMIYLHGRMKLGLTETEAAQRVTKYMFDYTGAHLGPVEKNIRRFLPFYQWIKQSLLLTVDQMLHNPRRYAQVDHLFKAAGAFTGAGTNQDPRLKPDFLGEQGAIPAPFSRVLNGSRTWLSTERPGTQASWLMAPLFRHDLAGAAQGFAQQLGPLPSAAVEGISGKYMFGDRSLDENYVPEKNAPWTAARGIEQTLGMGRMQAENVPEYWMRKLIGGYPGLATDTALNLVNPELVGNNPRFTGTDEAERRINHAISMLFGPRITNTKPEAVAEQSEKALGRMTKTLQNQESDKAKRRLGK